MKTERAVSGIKVHRDGREVCLDTAAGKREYKRRRHAGWEEQDGLCAICGFWMPEDEATLDHVRPRGMGAGFRDDRPENLRVVHLWCNSTRGSIRIDARKPGRCCPEVPSAEVWDAA